LNNSFNICTKVSVILSGGGAEWLPIATYFSKELDVGPAASQARIEITVTRSTSHSPSRLYGVSGGSDGDNFVVPDGAGHWCAFDPSALTVSQDLDVRLDVCCGMFRPTVLLDWLVMPIAHFGLAAFGLVPFHASAARISELPGPVVFSAWSGVGKTNLVMWAMTRGGEFFGDDQVIAETAGRLYPSFRRIGVYGYNRTLAPALPMRVRAKLSVGDTLHSRARMHKGRAAYVLAYAANGLASTRARAIDLGGTQATLTPAHAHVICRAVSGDSIDKTVEVERDPASLSALGRAHVAVMEYEYGWFRRFLQTWQWATPSSLDPWDRLQERWIVNLEAYFRAVPHLLSLDVPHGPARATARATWERVIAALTDRSVEAAYDSE
jgi:hypothetical protein